VLDFSSFSL